MSSNIKVNRICQYCNTEFTAKTTVTRYCSHTCNSRAHKLKAKLKKVGVSNTEMFHIQNKPQEDLKNKEFLTVKQVAQLMGLSVRTAYRIIGENKINAIKLSERKTIIKRTDIDVLFETPEPEYEIVIRKVEKIAYQAEIKDCYTIGEIQDKFGISDAGLYQLLKRENISKFTQGKFTYVAKRDIDNLLQKK